MNNLTEKAIQEYRENPEVTAALVRKYHNKPLSFEETRLLPIVPFGALFIAEEYQDAIIEYFRAEDNWTAENTARFMSDFSKFKWIPGWEKVIDNENWSFFPEIQFIKTENGVIRLYKNQAVQTEMQVETAKILGVEQVAEFERDHSFKENGEIKKDTINIVTKDGGAIDLVTDSYYGHEPIEPYLAKEWINRAKTRFIPDIKTGKTYSSVIILISNDLDFSKVTKTFQAEMKKPENEKFEGKIQLHTLSSLPRPS